MRPVLAVCCLLLVSTFLAGCPARDEGKTWLVRVNQQEIPVEAFNQRFRIAQKDLGDIPVLGPDGMRRLKDRILVELVSDELLHQEARRRGIKLPESDVERETARLRAKIGEGEWQAYLLEQYVDERVWRQKLRSRLEIDAMLEQEMLAHNPVSDSELKAYYRETTAQIGTRREIQINQIVVKQPDLAKAILGELKEGVAFADLARRHSIGPEAARGGVLGYFKQADLPSSFAAAFDLAANTLSPVVETEYGFHIFLITDIREGFITPFAQMRDNIYKTLAEEHKRAVHRKMLETLRAGSEIEINQDLWNQLTGN